MKKFESNSKTRSNDARLHRWLEANVEEDNLYELGNGVVVDVPMVAEDEHCRPVEYHFAIGHGVVERFDGAQLSETDAMYFVGFNGGDGYWTASFCRKYDSNWEVIDGSGDELFDELWDIFKEEVNSWEEEQQREFLGEEISAK